MPRELHKAVLVLIFASALVRCELDRSRDLHKDRPRRGIVRQSGELLLNGAKYPISWLRFLRSKRVLVKGATLYEKNALFVKYRKYGGKERADDEFTFLGPYDNHPRTFTDINGNMVKEGHTRGYTILLKYLKTDGATKYRIQMSKTPQLDGIQRAPVIQVDYIGPNFDKVQKNYFDA